MMCGDYNTVKAIEGYQFEKMYNSHHELNVEEDSVRVDIPSHNVSGFNETRSKEVVQSQRYRDAHERPIIISEMHKEITGERLLEDKAYTSRPARRVVSRKQGRFTEVILTLTKPDRTVKVRGFVPVDSDAALARLLELFGSECPSSRRQRRRKGSLRTILNSFGNLKEALKSDFVLSCQIKRGCLRREVTRYDESICGAVVPQLERDVPTELVLGSRSMVTVETQTNPNYSCFTVTNEMLSAPFTFTTTDDLERFAFTFERMGSGTTMMNMCSLTAKDVPLNSIPFGCPQLSSFGLEHLANSFFHPLGVSTSTYGLLTEGVPLGPLALGYPNLNVLPGFEELVKRLSEYENSDVIVQDPQTPEPKETWGWGGRGRGGRGDYYFRD